MINFLIMYRLDLLVRSKNKEIIQHFLYGDHNCSYEELLCKLDKCTMHVNRLRYLGIQIFRIANQLNPEFMLNVFEMRTFNRPSRRQNDLQHYRPR